jgi:hypothetical protein
MVKGTMISSSRLVLRNMTAACALMLTIAGCQSKTAPTKENYTAALNIYYASHDDCLFPGGLRFPFSVSAKPGAVTDSSTVSVKSLETLKDAGMLERTEDKDLHVNRYTLTTAGTRASARFCYGHRVISSIDSSTEPAKVNGFPETQIEYHYTMLDVPIWAKSEAIQAAFPEMGKAIKGEGTGKARLSQTLAGWQVPD